MSLSRYLSSFARALNTSGEAQAAALASGSVTQAKLASGVAGNGPAFSAYQSSAQTLTSNTITKINFQTEEYDTGSRYDTSNSRFTPNVAGYYQINGALSVSSGTTGVLLTIYKNGARHKDGVYPVSTNNATVSALVYFNGTTDYVELYGLFVSGQAASASLSATYFQGYLARAA